MIKGTRLSVEFIAGLLAAEWTVEEILGSYPGLKHEDVIACRNYLKQGSGKELQ